MLGRARMVRGVQRVLMLPVVVLRAVRCGARRARMVRDRGTRSPCMARVLARCMPSAACAGSGRLEKLRVKEAMTRGDLPHGGGGRRFAFGGRAFRVPLRGCVRSRRGRRVAAPTARGMGAGLLRFRYAQAFRVGHKKRGLWHAAAHTGGARSPHQPSGGSEGSRALRAVFVSPGFAGRAGSLRLWAQTFLTPLPARESSEGGREGSGATRRKRPPQADFFDARSARV